MRHRVSFFSIVALMCVCCASARAELIDNPAFKAWSKYTAGTNVTVTGTTEAAGQNMTMEIKQTLVSVAADEVTVEVVTNMKMGANAMPPQSQKIQVKRQIDPKTDPNSIDPALLEKAATEDVTVAGGKYTAKVVEMTKAQGPMTLKIKLWFSEEVPGGMVKMEGSGEGQMTMKMNMEVASVEKK